MRTTAGGGTVVRGLAARAVVAAMVVTAVAGLAGPAVATPAAVAAPAAAAGVAALPEASQEEKVRAAAVLGIVAGDDLLILNDRDFVFQIWRRASGQPEVRGAAELALTSGVPADCTFFIRTAIFDAARRDQDREVRDATAARIAREAKQRAAAVVGIEAGPELLILSDRDFVFQIWDRVQGPRVKEAALAALRGSAQDLTTFIESGIRTAHERDQREAIEADEKATEEEKARRAAEDAKSRAAAVLGIVATREILVLSDENFVRLIWNRSVEGTEVNAAAQAALRSADPADWKAFIDTGIFAANKRDIALALKRKAEQDRKLALEIQARAENSLVHPQLAQAARTALAGSDADVDRFLRVEQYEALTQSLRATTGDLTPWYVQSAGGDAAITPGTPPLGGSAPIPDATWKIVPGLGDPGCYSLESAGRPGRYLRHKDLRVQLAVSDGSDGFKNSATWCVRTGLTGSGVSFEAKSQPGRYLRHLGSELWAADAGGEHRSDRPCGFAASATWFIDVPDPQVQRRQPGPLPPKPTDPCVHDNTKVVLDGNRVVVLKTDGTALVKQGGLGADWVTLHAGVTQVALAGNRIGVLLANGTALVKEGGLGANWVAEHTGVKQLALAGDRIGVLLRDGTALVKEGGLSAIWVTEHTGVKQLALAGDRIGVVRTDGSALVKEGGLSAIWVTEHTGVEQLALAGDRIGVLLRDGTARVKEGGLSAIWVTEHVGVTQLVLAGNRIGVVRADGRSALVKEGGLSAIWTVQQVGVKELALAGDRIGIVRNDDSALAKQGGLGAGWTGLWAPH